MPTFYLYRVKVEFPAQKSLAFIAPPPSSEQLVREAVQARPESDTHRSTVWHIGNVEDIGKHGIYFRIGRITRSTVQRYDESTKDFVDEPLDQAPYTHVVLDSSLQVCAIAANPKLATSGRGIAKRMEELLSSAPPTKEQSATIVVAEITDPEDFISQLRDADAIMRFTAEFTLPNPFDVEEQFHRPMEAYLREARGKKGATTITGPDLNPTVLEKMTRSVAASGNDAKARFRLLPKGAAVVKKLKDNPATFVESISSLGTSTWRAILSKLRSTYDAIRNTAQKRQK